MNNLLRFSTLLVLILILTSCKKEYVCTCSGGGTSTSQITIESISRSQAVEACDAFEIDFLGTTSECSIN